MSDPKDKPRWTAQQVIKSVYTPDVIASVGLSVHDCPDCGVIHAIPTALCEQKRKAANGDGDERDIYCPNGHKWSWIDTLEAHVASLLDDNAPVEGAVVRKLQRELVQEKHAREQLEAEVTTLKRASRGKKQCKVKGGAR